MEKDNSLKTSLAKQISKSLISKYQSFLPLSTKEIHSREMIESLERLGADIDVQYHPELFPSMIEINSAGIDNVGPAVINTGSHINSLMERIKSGNTCRQ